MGPGTEAGTQELSHAISSGGVSQAATPSNRIAVYEDLRFAYDVHGNITECRIGWHTVQQLSYSAEHQLKSITVFIILTTIHIFLVGHFMLSLRMR